MHSSRFISHKEAQPPEESEVSRTIIFTLCFFAHIVKAGEFCLVLKAGEWQRGFSPI
jgi:hypothetical protein